MEKSEKFEARWLRILACTGAKNDSALARILDILPQSVTAARKRAQIPTGWIENISEQYGVSTDWLFFGRGPMHIATDIEQCQNDAPTSLQASCPRCAKLEAKLEISEEERRELSAENRRLYQEKSILERENGDLREKVARLEERKRRDELTHGLPSEDSGVA